MRVNSLQAIVYVSTAVRPPDTATLQHLLDRARARNVDLGVTGLLLYADGSFMQYIEGPPPGLSEVYRIIREDPLHHSVMELLNEPIETREFGNWAMSYNSQTLPAFLAPLRRATMTGGESDPPLGPGRQLLKAVWQESRRQLG